MNTAEAVTSDRPRLKARATSSFVSTSSARHVAAINTLAADVQRPVEEIHVLYHAELTRLARSATVLDFLPVLVMKRVREHYRVRIRALKQAYP
jgi:hypothetical protein